MGTDAEELPSEPEPLPALLPLNLGTVANEEAFSAVDFTNMQAEAIHKQCVEANETCQLFEQCVEGNKDGGLQTNEMVQELLQKLVDTQAQLSGIIGSSLLTPREGDVPLGDDTMQELFDTNEHIQTSLTIYQNLVGQQ